MTQAGPLHWLTGAGWLVLGGGGDWREGETEEVDAAVLGWADLTRPIAVLPTAGISTEEAEALLEYYVDLGGPNGSVVPINSVDDARDAENCKEIADAGLIVVADGLDMLSLVTVLRDQPASEAMADAFATGTAVIGRGAGSAALGAWVGESQGGRFEQGWAWLKNGIVEPYFASTEPAGRLRGMLREHPECLGIGVPRGGGLALGPNCEVVTLGPAQVTVVVDVDKEAASS